MIEKRKHKRFLVVCKAECTDARVTVRNMSEDGLNLETSYFFKETKNISFSLVVPNLNIIVLKGDIIWNKKSKSDKFLYGVNITEISPEHKKKYMDYIRSLTD